MVEIGVGVGVGVGVGIGVGVGVGVGVVIDDSFDDSSFLCSDTEILDDDDRNDRLVVIGRGIMMMFEVLCICQARTGGINRIDDDKNKIVVIVDVNDEEEDGEKKHTMPKMMTT